MSKLRHWSTLAPLLAVLALMVAACGRDAAAPVADASGPEETEPTDEDTAAATGADEATGEVAYDVGVTGEPCPDAVNPDNGCIYLGTISDLTEGPFVGLAVPVTDAQAAFWRTVNEAGGIGGFDVDVATYTRDNKYNPEVHNEEYQAIKNDVLALAQTLGSPTTAQILDDLRANQIFAAPASWTSLWAFEDVILESGANYCFEAMNSIDYAVEEHGVSSVVAVGYPGDYGGDAAVGVELAAEANGIEFSSVEVAPGAMDPAIAAITSSSPGLVHVTVGPEDTAALVGGAVAQGYTGRFIGTSPTWHPSLLDSGAGPALEETYEQSSPFAPWGAETPGHERAREALGDVAPGDFYIAGWVWQYPIKALLEAAVDNGDLTRAGLAEAADQLDTVDYEGMQEPADFAGEPNDAAIRASVINAVDPDSPTGVTLVRDFFVGPTAVSHEFTASCFQP